MSNKQINTLILTGICTISAFLIYKFELPFFLATISILILCIVLQLMIINIFDNSIIVILIADILLVITVTYLMISTIDLQMYFYGNSVSGLSFALIIIFLSSILLTFVLHWSIKRFIKKEIHDQDSISKLTIIANFLTFLITIILLISSTFSSVVNNNEMNSLNKRLMAVETHFTELDLLKEPINISNKTEKETDNLNFALLVVAIIIYVLASYYTLFPIINRRIKKQEIDHQGNNIKIPLNIIEIAEIEAILRTKHKYIKLYDEKDKEK